MEDADGRVTKLDYDELNRLFKTTRDPGGLELTSTTTDFDEDGHPLRILEANGEVTRQTWDELGRLATRTHEPASGWTAPWAYTTEERYGYDANSNLERVQELDSRTGGGGPPERVTTRGYDRLDRQTSEAVTLQDETTSSVTTEYFKDGRVKSVTDPRGVTSYTYDGQGREETITTSGGVTRKTFYLDGLVKDITFPNGTNRAHGYDKADRLLTIVTTKEGAIVTSTAYTYDSNGNRLSQVQTNGGSEEATTYTYDDLDRLATVTYAPDATHPNGRKVTYGHDGAGNRKTEVVTNPQTEAVLESKTSHFDNANRLTALTDNLDAVQTTTLAWDRNGNLLSETKAGATTNYRYDLRDTLAEVERGGQPLARFLGDFDERRVLKIGDPVRPGGSGVQEYVYNGSRLILDVENGQPTARYEWTNEELVSLLQTGGVRRYFALDGLETVLALTDEAGQATDRLNFDAWGVPKEGTDFGASGSRFAFTSHRFDTELNLYYAGGRMYSPTIGRFISQDTLSLDPNNPDTWNLFSYARGNPTRYVDPTGHCTAEATYANFQDCFTGGLKGVFGPPTNFVLNWGSALLYNATGDERFRARGEAFQEQKAAVDKSFESPAWMLTKTVEGFEGQLSGFSEAINEGRGAEAAEIFGGGLAQAPLMAETGGAMRVTPSAALVTAEGRIIQAGGTISLRGGPAATGILLSGNAKDNDVAIVQENTPTQDNAAGVKIVETKGAPAPEVPTATPKRGGAAPVRAGQHGEQVGTEVSGLPKNTRRIPSASGKRAYRVPDHMDDTERFIQEDKATKKQHRSSQILDDKAHVLRGGGAGRVDVLVDESTEVTRPLLREHLNPGSPIKLKTDKTKRP